MHSWGRDVEEEIIPVSQMESPHPHSLTLSHITFTFCSDSEWANVITIRTNTLSGFTSFTQWKNMFPTDSDDASLTDVSRGHHSILLIYWHLTPSLSPPSAAHTNTHSLCLSWWKGIFYYVWMDGATFPVCSSPPHQRMHTHTHGTLKLYEGDYHSNATTMNNHRNKHTSDRSRISSLLYPNCSQHPFGIRIRLWCQLSLNRESRNEIFHN